MLRPRLWNTKCANRVWKKWDENGFKQENPDMPALCPVLPVPGRERLFLPGQLSVKK